MLNKSFKIKYELGFSFQYLELLQVFQCSSHSGGEEGCASARPHQEGIPTTHQFHSHASSPNLISKPPFNPSSRFQLPHQPRPIPPTPILTRRAPTSKFRTPATPILTRRAPHIFLLEGLTCWEEISGRILLEGYGWGNLVGDNFVGRNIDGRSSRNIAGRNLAGRNQDLAGRNLAGQNLLDVILLGGGSPGRILLGVVLH